MARALTSEGWSPVVRLDWRGLVVGLGTAIFIAADLVVGGYHLATLTLAAAVVVLGIVGAIRWPGIAFGVILVVVPLQLAAFAYLYKLGVPQPIVRDLGFIKDGATLGIAIAAVRTVRADPDLQRRIFDRLDWLALIYVGIATAYLLIPILIPGTLGGEPLSIRFSAWRTDCEFIVLMLAMRRVALSQESIRRALSWMFVVAGILGGFAIWEAVSNGGYENFMVKTIDLPQYQLNILHVYPPLGDDYVNRGPIGGGNSLRVGSLFADTLGLGYYMVLPLAFGIERVRSSTRLLPIIGTLAGGITVVLANTRSAILSGAIVVVLSLWLAFRQRSRFRIAMVVIGLAGALAVAPFVLHSGVRARFDQAFGSSQTSDETGHISRSANGVSDVIDHPAGFGLGANPATGLRNDTGNSTDTENSYLTIGTELGAGAMLVWIGMYLAMLSAVRRNRHLPGEAGRLANATWLAGVGLLIGGLFLPIWLNFASSLTFFGLAGLASRRHRPDATEVGEDDELAELEPSGLQPLGA